MSGRARQARWWVLLGVAPPVRAGVGGWRQAAEAHP